MDLLTNIRSWGDIERNLEQKFNELNQSVDSGLNSAHEARDGFSRRVNNGTTATSVGTRSSGSGPRLPRAAERIRRT